MITIIFIFVSSGIASAHTYTVDKNGNIYKNGRWVDTNKSEVRKALQNDPNGQKALQEARDVKTGRSGGTSGGSSSGGSSGGGRSSKSSGGGGSSSGWGGSESKQKADSPYAGTEYRGQQNLLIDPGNGQPVLVRGDIYGANNTDGRMAVPEDRLSSDVRAALDAAGVQKDANGNYLIHEARNNSNVQVDWSIGKGQVLTDSNLSGSADPNVDLYNPAHPGDGYHGGSAMIRIIPLPPSGGSGGGGGGGGRYIPDNRILIAFPPGSQEAGKSVELKAAVSGTTDKVTVNAPWGAKVDLTNSSGTWSGTLNIPYKVTEGDYTLTFTANIGQPPHYNAKEFSTSATLKVLRPPDNRKLTGYSEWPVVKAGQMLPFVAEVSGTAKSVKVSTAWGSETTLEKESDGKFRGFLSIPATVHGVYPVKIGALISQPPHYPASDFSTEVMITVEGVTTGNEVPWQEPVPYDSFDDWWTPPGYGGW